MERVLDLIFPIHEDTNQGGMDVLPKMPERKLHFFLLSIINFEIVNFEIDNLNI